MIALDTNILVRYLVRDDEKQARSAAKYIEKNCDKEMPGLISLLVLSEIIWVLDRFYKFKRGEICQYLEAILSAQEFEVEKSVIAAGSFEEFKAGKADFADYLIKNTALDYGAESLATFDKRAGQEKGFYLLKA